MIGIIKKMPKTKNNNVELIVVNNELNDDTTNINSLNLFVPEKQLTKLFPIRNELNYLSTIKNIEKDILKNEFNQFLKIYSENHCELIISADNLQDVETKVESTIVSHEDEADDGIVEKYTGIEKIDCISLNVLLEKDFYSNSFTVEIGELLAGGGEQKITNNNLRNLPSIMESILTNDVNSSQSGEEDSDHETGVENQENQIKEVIINFDGADNNNNNYHDNNNHITVFIQKSQLKKIWEILKA